MRPDPRARRRRGAPHGADLGTGGLPAADGAAQRSRARQRPRPPDAGPGVREAAARRRVGRRRLADPCRPHDGGPAMAAPVGLIHHDPAVVPGTHALVIGVGTYPHLQGGQAQGRRTDGLGQLGLAGPGVGLLAGERRRALPQGRRPWVRRTGGRRGWSSPSGPARRRPTRGCPTRGCPRRRRPPPGQRCARRSPRPVTGDSLCRLGSGRRARPAHRSGARPP